MPSISLASYFRADHLTFHPSIPLASFFVSSIPWASYFRADHLLLHPLVRFFLCRPYNSPSVHCFGELFLCRPSLGESYFRADHLIIHPLARYFNVYHIPLHPSIPLASYFVPSNPWASYFRADHLILHPLASYFCADQPLGELFSCLLFDSPSFGELFSC